ncbi:hypothetical protein GQ42DRAFT_57941 [Ramicandelaber brevisporus]|nr:hypothetical protein GQ42DRAFT_57941 [Ramicandelaber brevisporus]
MHTQRALCQLTRCRRWRWPKLWQPCRWLEASATRPATPAGTLFDRYHSPTSESTLSSIDDAFNQLQFRPSNGSMNQQQQQQQQNENGKHGEKPPRGASDYHMNVGRALLILRDEIELFPIQGLTTLDIYSPRIILEERSVSGLHVHGKRPYLATAAVVRRTLSWWFADPTLTIQSIRQERLGGNGGNGGNGGSSSNSSTGSNESSGGNGKDQQVASPSNEPSPICLHVRWSFEGTPRTSSLVVYMLAIMRNVGDALGIGRRSDHGYYSSTAPSIFTIRRSRFDGIFTYEFDSEGLISCHRIVTIRPLPGSWAVRRIASWWWSAIWRWRLAPPPSAAPRLGSSMETIRVPSKPVRRKTPKPF